MIEGLPARLREARLRCRYTQKFVAERVHVSQSMIAGYESGYRTPNAETLLALAYLYQCSTDYLLGKEKLSGSVVLNLTGFSSEQIDALSHLIDTIRPKA